MSEFYFGSTQKEVSVGQTFDVGLLLNTQGQRVNALEGQWVYNGQLVQPEAVSIDSSFVSFWITKPALIPCHEITCSLPLSGIIVGGYDGANGPIATVTFRADKAGKAQMEFQQAQALLHDGRGSSTVVTQAPFEFSVRDMGLVGAVQSVSAQTLLFSGILGIVFILMCFFFLWRRKKSAT